MPRYFFHVADGETFTDEIGTQLDSLSEARAHAVKTAKAMIRNHSLNRWDHEVGHMRVTSGTAETVLSLRFSADGIEAIGGHLPESGPEYAYGQKLSQDEAALVRSFRGIPEGEIRETILELVGKIASETEMSLRVRLI